MNKTGTYISIQLCGNPCSNPLYYLLLSNRNAAAWYTI